MSWFQVELGKSRSCKTKGERSSAGTISVTQPEAGSAVLMSPLLFPWLLLTHRGRRQTPAPANREKVHLPACRKPCGIGCSAGARCCWPPSGEGELQLLPPWRYPLGSPHCAPSWVLLACAQALSTVLHLPERWDVPKEHAWLFLDFHFNVLNLVCL